jgi:hypothetical protein
LPLFAKSPNTISPWEGTSLSFIQTKFSRPPWTIKSKIPTRDHRQTVNSWTAKGTNGSQSQAT